MAATVVLFSLDLRLEDHAALQAAVRRGDAVVPLYVWDEAGEQPHPPGLHSRWWLAGALLSLDARLRRIGSRLLVRRGNLAAQVLDVARAVGADAVYWSRRYAPHHAAADAGLTRALAQEGLEARSFAGTLLYEPTEVLTRAGGQFKVFSQFMKAAEPRFPFMAAPTPAPEALTAPAWWPDGLPVAAVASVLGVPTTLQLDLPAFPGGADERLRTFTSDALERYADDRERPDLDGTSFMSPYLHFGEVSPRQVWHAASAGGGRGAGAWTLRRELLWRDFSYHLLAANPGMPQAPLRPEFATFPWSLDAEALDRWQAGQTGYPLVDAGMRSLNATGWMHNRVRMVASSFLVKHLLVPWQQGEAVFWRQLVDADLANNSASWQWVAGCGVDAAPFFRIFNPVLQGQKFDPTVAYVRTWVPELAGLPAQWVHRPWAAPAGVLQQAGVTLGATYPLPFVDHDQARARALAAFACVTKAPRQSVLAL